jgi:hypothetical protein
MKSLSIDGNGTKKLVPIYVITWAVFFTIGVVGHLQLKNPLIESLFKSLQLFHLHYHPFPEGTVGVVTDQAVPWTIEIARFGAGLWALSLLPALIAVFFEERIKLWWIKCFWRDHYIVCGECSRSLALVRDLRRERLKVIMIGTCSHDDLNLPAGVVHLNGDSAEVSILKKAMVHRAKHIIALHENDNDNIETLIATAKLCEKRPKTKGPVEAHAHISNIHLQSGLHNIFTIQGDLSNAGMKENIFNYYELIARFFARNFPYPPILVESKTEPVHLIIVGFGSFGQNVALKFVKMAQQLYSVKGKKWKVIKPRITIVDPIGNAAITQFMRSYPKFKDKCVLNVCEFSTKDKEFWELDFFKTVVKKEITSMVLCLENESVTMSVLDTLMDISRVRGSALDYIFIRIAQPERLSGLLSKIKRVSGGPDIVSFASDKEIFNSNVLLNRSLDKLARVFHQAYLKVDSKNRNIDYQLLSEEKKWEVLLEDFRQSNREVADHTWAILRMMGYKIEEVPADKQVESNDKIISELDNKKEELARFEHYRWMVSKILDGWECGPYIEGEKSNPCIVKYEELDEPTKDKDRANILAIIELFRNGTLRIVR